VRESALLPRDVRVVRVILVHHRGERETREHRLCGHVILVHHRGGHVILVHHRAVRDLLEHHRGERETREHHRDDVMVDGNQNLHGEHAVRELDDLLRSDLEIRGYRMAFRHPYVVVFRMDSKHLCHAWQHAVLRRVSLTLVRLRRTRFGKRAT
jgi:hypothetical protein